MSSTALENGVSTVQEIESTPQGVVKRWCAEWEMADKAEKEWREDVEKVWELYQSKKAADNTFNIFWSNVETLRPAVYNSTPRPDVRRRFRDVDPQGKVAATILERSLTFQLDQNDFNHEIESLVLDLLVAGRGIARELYVPVFGMQAEGEIEGQWLDEVEPAEEILDQTGATRHVAWNDFRHGPGKKWSELPWIGFRHQFPYDALVRQFGKEKADKVPLSQVPDDAKQYPKDVGSLLKVAEVYEIWDKAARRCLFICPGYKEGPLHSVDDPLKLTDFWPVPRAIYAIEDSTTLVPAIPYKKYEQQARELNRITARINKVVHALKVRGAYAAHLSEVGQIIQAEDNVMVPITNASEIANMGGLDKAIWIMPIEKLVTVLEGLYVAREKTIQAIYEITGLGDVMRGVSNPHETLGAQQMKSQWGSMRLQRLQRDVQRFIRDLLRVKAEIIAEQFEPETLESMTGIQLPTDEEKAALQQQMAMIQQQMQPGMMGAPPQVDPAVGEQLKEAEKILALPSWEEIMKILRSDVLRQYRMDIETDSTIQETVNRDAQGMQEAITAIGALFATVAPAVKEGYLSVEVVKTLASAVSRTARAGQAVEDAIDMIEQPPPQPGMDPAQQKMLEDAQKNVEAGQKEIESGKAELQKISQQLREEKMGLEGQKVKAEVDTQKQLAQIEKAKMDLQREAEKRSADLEKQARDLEAIKAEIEMARKLLQSEEQVRGAAEQARKAERGTEEAKLEAHFTKKESAIAGQGLAVEKKGIEQKGKEVEAKANEPKSADQVAAMIQAMTDGLAKIAEMQKEVAEKQTEVLAGATKPKSHKLKKNADGSWDVKSTE
jgi:hypothetical protein